MQTWTYYSGAALLSLIAILIISGLKEQNVHIRDIAKVSEEAINSRRKKVVIGQLILAGITLILAIIAYAKY